MLLLLKFCICRTEAVRLEGESGTFQTEIESDRGVGLGGIKTHSSPSRYGRNGRGSGQLQVFEADSEIKSFSSFGCPLFTSAGSSCPVPCVFPLFIPHLWPIVHTHIHTGTHTHTLALTHTCTHNHMHARIHIQITFHRNSTQGH